MLGVCFDFLQHLLEVNIGALSHLADLEPLWFRRADQLFAGEAQLAAADLANRRTSEANRNARPLDDVLAARTAMHPRLQKPMRLVDLAEFVAEHDDHHLVVITELSTSKRPG